MKSGFYDDGRVNKYFRNFFLTLRYKIKPQTLGNPINDFMNNAKFFHGIIRSMLGIFL